MIINICEIPQNLLMSVPLRQQKKQKEKKMLIVPLSIGINHILVKKSSEFALFPV